MYHISMLQCIEAVRSTDGTALAVLLFNHGFVNCQYTLFA